MKKRIQALEKTKTENTSLCPVCKEQTVFEDTCIVCGWVNYSGDSPEHSMRSPRGFIADREFNSYYFKKSWRSLSRVFLSCLAALLVFLYIAANEFSTDIKIFFYKEKLLSGELLPGQINPWWGIAIVILLYSFTVALVNSTRIRVSAERLEVKRGPLYIPFLKTFSLFKSEILRIDIVHEYSTGRSRTSNYQIVAAATNERTFPILSLPKRERAEQIALFLRNILLLES